ncbi:MAG: alpha/beta hydrolase [Geobacteraceae bacterium]|nr:alpha/beta hydrolase [Geobacteraceae bacterium]
MPYLTTSDSSRLYYEEAGAGNPLLFVHGWSLSSQIWLQQKEYFSSRYRCIAFDLRGHGRSMPSCSGYGIDILASDVTLFFDRLCLSGVTLLGWSLGALIVLAAYPAVRERLASLVLVSGTSKYCSSTDYPHGLPPKEPRSLSLLLKRNPHKAMDGFLRKMFADERQAEKGFEAFQQDVLSMLPFPSPEVMIPVLQTLETADMRPVLPLVREPSLLLHGDRDLICPVDSSHYMSTQLSGSQCTILNGAGHAPMYSRSNAFNSALATFLGKVYE